MRQEQHTRTLRFAFDCEYTAWLPTIHSQLMRKAQHSVAQHSCFAVAVSDSPYTAAADVPIAVQRGAAGLNIVWRQRQLLFDFINHAAAACVYAHVLKSQLEVGDVWPHVLAAQQLARNHVERKQQLLRQRQH